MKALSRTELIKDPEDYSELMIGELNALKK